MIFSLAKATVTDEPETVRMVTEASPIPDLKSAKGVPLFNSKSGIQRRIKEKALLENPTVIDGTSLSAVSGIIIL